MRQHFKKKIEQIEAMQFNFDDVDNHAQCLHFCPTLYLDIDGQIKMRVPNGGHISSEELEPGDWIVKDDNGFKIVSLYEFNDLYEPIGKIQEGHDYIPIGGRDYTLPTKQQWTEIYTNDPSIYSVLAELICRLEKVENQ